MIFISHQHSDKDFVGDIAQTLKDTFGEEKVFFVFCKTFLHNIAKKKYTPLRLKFFSNYCGFDRAFLSR